MKINSELSAIVFFMEKPEVTEVKVKGLYEVSKLYIFVRLSFWYRLWACFSGDYRAKTEQIWNLEVNQSLDEDEVLDVTVKLVL